MYMYGPGVWSSSRRLTGAPRTALGLPLSVNPADIIMISYFCFAVARLIRAQDIPLPGPRNRRYLLYYHTSDSEMSATKQRPSAADRDIAPSNALQSDFNANDDGDSMDADERYL
ncbi:hypothetical protein LTR91_021451, partial [Friedmanniomyces endolithicus]